MAPWRRRAADGQRLASMRRRPRAPVPSDEAVSPVIGTLMVLSITVISIATVLIWGGPAIDRVQGSAALSTMVGELAQVREAAFQMRGADAGRTVSVTVPDGLLESRAGTPLLVSVSHVSGCELSVRSWADGDAWSSAADATAPGCGPVIEMYELQGASRIPRADGSVVSLDRDWAWEVKAAPGASVDAEAFLFAGDRLAWTRHGTDETAAYLEGGAILSREHGTLRVREEPRLSGDEGANPQDAVLLKLPMFRATDRAGVGQGSHQAQVTLESSVVLIDAQVFLLRVEAAGGEGSAWCAALLLRNSFLPTPRWTETSSGAPAATAPPCDDPRTDGADSIPYHAASYERNGGTAAFGLHLQHNVMDVRLAL